MPCWSGSETAVCTLSESAVSRTLGSPLLLRASPGLLGSAGAKAMGPVAASQGHGLVTQWPWAMGRQGKLVFVVSKDPIGISVLRVLIDGYTHQRCSCSDPPGPGGAALRSGAGAELGVRRSVGTR